MSVQPTKQKPVKATMSADRLLSITATMKNDSTSAHIDTIGMERLPVKLIRSKLDAELVAFHDQQMAFIHNTRNKANEKAISIFEKIMYKMRWAVPPIPQAQRNNTVDFCKHLLGETPTAEFQDIKIFDAWLSNATGKTTEKITRELAALCYSLKDTVVSRNDIIEAKRDELVNQTNKMTLRREAQLRWAVENTHGQRNTYWTIWYLSAQCLMPELRRFCENEANRVRFLKATDLELGWTALHYAVKNNHLEVVKYLISLDESPENSPDRIELAKTPDGRTPLHLAAAYASREVVLELLALGCGTQVKDNVGCYPVDLAIQNKNQEAFVVLSRWNKLVPDDPNANLIVEKAEEILEEYLDTPDHVIDKMSTDLRIVSRRIEKIKAEKTSFMTNCTCSQPTREGDMESLCPGCKDSVKYINDLFLEMRLCDKCYKMAFKEGFVYDGLKALRRKWMVAKKIFLKQLGLGFKHLDLSQIDESNAFCDFNRSWQGEHSYDPNATLRRNKETLSSSLNGSIYGETQLTDLNDSKVLGGDEDNRSFNSSAKFNDGDDIDRDVVGDSKVFKEDSVMENSSFIGDDLNMNSAFLSTIASENSFYLNQTGGADVNHSDSKMVPLHAVESNSISNSVSNSISNGVVIRASNDKSAKDNNPDSFDIESKQNSTDSSQIASKDLDINAANSSNSLMSSGESSSTVSGNFDIDRIASLNKQSIPSISNISDPRKPLLMPDKKLVGKSNSIETASLTASGSTADGGIVSFGVGDSKRGGGGGGGGQRTANSLNASSNIAANWTMYTNELAVKDSHVLKRYGLQGMSGEALIDIGLELAERLIQDCQEGIAAVVLEECGNVPVNAINTKIAVFARRSEVITFLYDYITYFVTQKTRQDYNETRTLTPADVLDMDEGVVDEASGTRSFTNVFNRLARLSTIGKPREYYDSYDASRFINLKSILTDTSSFDYDFVGKNRDVTLIRRKLLDKGLNTIKEAIIMHEKEYSHVLIEPATLAPLLEISSMYFERQGNNVASFHALTRAVVVYQRALGAFHKDAVRVMLDTLRLQIKCSDIDGLKQCTLKATEISRELDKLSKVDEKAADLLSRKCAEMLGLCKLIEQELKKKNNNGKKSQKKFDSKAHQSIIKGLKTQEISQDELNGEHRGSAYYNPSNNFSDYFSMSGLPSLVVKISQADNVFFENDGVFSSLSILQYSPLTNLINK